MEVERRLGGLLLDKPKELLFQFSAAANLAVSIQDFSPGWRCKQNANYQVIDDWTALFTNKTIRHYY